MTGQVRDASTPTPSGYVPYQDGPNNPFWNPNGGGNGGDRDRGSRLDRDPTGDPIVEGRIVLVTGAGDGIGKGIA